MTPNPRTVDLLTTEFNIQERRKFELKNDAGKKVIDLYFRPLTRSDRIAANSATNSTDALAISTRILCMLAELEDGSKAFASSDAENLKRFLPETVLNDLEIFMMGINVDLGAAKND